MNTLGPYKRKLQDSTPLSKATLGHEAVYRAVLIEIFYYLFVAIRNI
jgi:hypothetical protein